VYGWPDSLFNFILNTLEFVPKDKSEIFNVTQNGNFTGNFEKLSSPIPSKY
jgi:hypothetical protein